MKKIITFFANLFGNKSTTPKVGEDTPENQALREISAAFRENNFSRLAELIPAFISQYGSLDIQAKCWDYYIYCDEVDSTTVWKKVHVFGRSDVTIDEFVSKLCNGETPDVDKYQNRFQLQQELKKAFDLNNVLVFDKLLSDGADINYPYNNEFPLWDTIKHHKDSLMYKYFLTRDDCPQVIELRKTEELIKNRKNSLN